KQNSEIQNYETEKKVRNEQLRNLNEKNDRLSKELVQDKQQFNHIHYGLKRVKEELFTEVEKLQAAEHTLKGQLKEVETLNSQQRESKKALDEVMAEKASAQNKL